jgi:hypothetical protein
MPVESLTVSVVGDSETLLAEWDAISDPSVLSYRVYCGTHIDSLQFYEETTDTFCEVAGLTDGELHYVAISTVDGEANTGNRCAGSGTPRLLPLCPASFRESPALGSITLSWSPNHELDLQGYRIYRSIDPQENGELLTDIAAIDSLYIDTDFPNAYETYYYYRISAYDTQDNASELSEPISSRPVSLIQSILIVDETRKSPGTNPFLPNEIAVENFYAECFAEFSNVSRIDLEEFGTNLRLADIGIYSTMFWHANDNTEVDYPFYIRDDIERYIQLGGKVLFSQYFPGKAFELSAGYPATFPGDSFINRVLGIAGADYHVGARFKYALPLVDNLPVLQVDSLKTIASWEGHSFGVETIQPGNSDEAKYSYASDYDDDSSQGQLNGGTIGILHPYGEGLAFCLSFPLFNMQIDGAKNLIEYTFEHLFGVPTAVASAELTAPEALTLCANFPNPFNEKTSFTILSRDTQSPVSIDVYNLKGQRVMRLYQGEIKEETELIWDGKDFRGRACASGIYFLRANQSGHIVTRKVLLLKTP